MYRRKIEDFPFLFSLLWKLNYTRFYVRKGGRGDLDVINFVGSIVLLNHCFNSDEVSRNSWIRKRIARCHKNGIRNICKFAVHVEIPGTSSSGNTGRILDRATYRGSLTIYPHIVAASLLMAWKSRTSEPCVASPSLSLSLSWVYNEELSYTREPVRYDSHSRSGESNGTDPLTKWPPLPRRPEAASRIAAIHGKQLGGNSRCVGRFWPFSTMSSCSCDCWRSENALQSQCAVESYGVWFFLY